MNLRVRIYEILLQVIEICIREAHDSKNEIFTCELIEYQNAIVEMRNEELRKIIKDQEIH